MSESYSETIKLALCGESESGKTHQAGYLIEEFGADNVGIISAERGLNTIVSLVTPENVRECDSMDDVRAAFKWAKERYDRHDGHLFVDGGTRILDWIANAEHKGADDCLECVVKGEPVPAELAEFRRFITKEKNIDTGKVWQRIAMNSVMFLDALKKARWNLYMTFWADKTPTGQYNRDWPMQVDAQGKGSRDAVYGTFDYVFHIVKGGDKKRVVYTETSSKYKCKRRLDPRLGIVIPEEMVDFNLAKFVRMLRGDK